MTYDGTWVDNLFNFIRMVIPKLTRDLPHPFSMDGVVRFIFDHEDDIKKVMFSGRLL